MVWGTRYLFNYNVFKINYKNIFGHNKICEAQNKFARAPPSESPPWLLACSNGYRTVLFSISFVSAPSSLSFYLIFSLLSAKWFCFNVDVSLFCIKQTSMNKNLIQTYNNRVISGDSLGNSGKPSPNQLFTLHTPPGKPWRLFDCAVPLHFVRLAVSSTLWTLVFRWLQCYSSLTHPHGVHLLLQEVAITLTDVVQYVFT